MSRIQRIRHFLSGCVMLLAGLALWLIGEDSLYVITAVLGVTLFLSGIRSLVYYFSMARYMVGGKAALLSGVFLLDLGIFTATVIDESEIAIVLYLVGLHAFSAVVSILRAREQMRNKGNWKMSLLYGIGNLVIVILCLVYADNRDVLVDVYCWGLIYSAVLRIITAFRRTEIVFVQ